MSGSVGEKMNIFPLPALDQRFLRPPTLSLVTILTEVAKI
jgi:hypothetical protein